MDKLEKQVHEFLEPARIKIAKEHNLDPEQVKFDPDSVAEIKKMFRNLENATKKLSANFELKF